EIRKRKINGRGRVDQILVALAMPLRGIKKRLYRGKLLSRNRLSLIHTIHTRGGQVFQSDTVLSGGQWNSEQHGKTDQQPACQASLASFCTHDLCHKKSLAPGIQHHFAARIQGAFDGGVFFQHSRLIDYTNQTTRAVTIQYGQTLSSKAHKVFLSLVQTHVRVERLDEIHAQNIAHHTLLGSVVVQQHSSQVRLSNHTLINLLLVHHIQIAHGVVQKHLQGIAHLGGG